MTNLTRAQTFALSTAASFLLPLAIPGVGLDYQFFFIAVFVLLAWFIFKWDKVKEISQRGGKAEMLLGASLIAADYAFNALRGSSVGILDLLIIFLGTVIAFYGVRSLKLFWVPATYGMILLLGYQIEDLTPNLVALQDWLAGVMASTLSAVGVSSTAAGEVVSMATPNGASLLLDVRGSCTGVQGIFAFGILSTMTLLDLKPKMSRIIPIFAIGFVGAFLTNILRLLVEFLTYEYVGVDVGSTLHFYLGYLVFIAWVVAFWALAFRYLAPVQSSAAQPSSIQLQLRH
jgi:exosortase